jgi:protein translocase SecG subunit
MDTVVFVLQILMWFLCPAVIGLILLQGAAGDISSSFGGGGQLDASLGVGAHRKMAQVTGFLAALFFIMVLTLAYPHRKSFHDVKVTPVTPAAEKPAAVQPTETPATPVPATTPVTVPAEAPVTMPVLEAPPAATPVDAAAAPPAAAVEAAPAAEAQPADAVQPLPTAAPAAEAPATQPAEAAPAAEAPAKP